MFCSVTFLLKLLLAIILLAATGFADTVPPKIGLITDLSGRFSTWGNQTVSGIMLAKEELARDGIDSELIVEDCALDPMRAATAAQKLITVDKVDALYLELTAPSIAVAPIAARHNIPMFYISLAESPLTTHPGAFKSYIEASDGCALIAQHWKSRGVTKVGILKATAEYGELCAAGTLREYPQARIVEYNPNEDVLAQVMLLKKEKVEAIVNVGYDPDSINMFKIFKRLNFVPYVALSQMTPPVISILSNAQLDKIFTYGLSDISPEFVSSINRLAKRESNTVSIEAAAYSYVHFPQIVQALEHCKEKKEVDCLLKSLLTNPPNNLTGFQYWTKDRRAKNKLFVYQWTEGKAHLVSSISPAH